MELNRKVANNKFDEVDLTALVGTSIPGVIDTENMLRDGDEFTITDKTPIMQQHFGTSTTPVLCVDAVNAGTTRGINFYLSALTRPIWPCEKDKDGIITTDTSKFVSPAGTAVDAFKGANDLADAVKALIGKKIQVSFVKEIEVQKTKFQNGTAVPQQATAKKKLFNFNFGK